MVEAAKVAGLKPLSREEQEDAAFRARDMIWAVIGDLFDRYSEEGDLTFAALGRRIGRSRAQVQKWLSSPRNMTLQSAGLLAEGMDADLWVTITPRLPARPGVNYAHPCEDAAAGLVRLSFSGSTADGFPASKISSSSPIAADHRCTRTEFSWQPMAD